MDIRVWFLFCVGSRESSNTFTKCLLILLTLFTVAQGQSAKCDQASLLETSDPPTDDKGLFQLAIQNAVNKNDKYYYSPDQTYVLTIEATNPTRPFRWFMITAEDPGVDGGNFGFNNKDADVGSLKTLDKLSSRYSERCSNSVENVDNSEKTHVEIHWISPKPSSPNQAVRIRGMVAETHELWYTGENLTVEIYKNTQRLKDSPPLSAQEVCNLCSEARYEVIFNGQWSRMAHPRHYPAKPDENGYTHMIGASHSYNFTLWQEGSKARAGLEVLLETADPTKLEREIIQNMALEGGTRTLIRGKRRHHPFMSEPSHSLFRVDRHNHLFSIVVGLRPSPDWFLGTSNFELCDKNQWWEYTELPLYPWDAGTMDGVSYESIKSKTEENVERVKMGSFDEESPFYQMNLDEMKPFAILTVRRLDVYPLIGADCSETQAEDSPDEAEEEQQDEPEEPIVAESRQNLDWGRGNCPVGDWGDWSPCIPNDGSCGVGFRTRTRRTDTTNIYNDYSDDANQNSNCQGNQDKQIQYQNCFIEC